jgi:hypothetical protein
VLLGWKTEQEKALALDLRAVDKGGRNLRRNQRRRKPDRMKIERAITELEQKPRTKISEENCPKQEHTT